MSTPAPALHLIRPVVIALIAVMTSFLLALWVSHARTDEISARAESIAERSENPHAVENARQIARVHEESRDLAFSLGALGIIAALAAGGLALGVIRKQSKLVDEHAQLLDTRARELEAFAYRVAHDLRNPLGTIALRLQAMRMDASSDKAQLDKLTRSLTRMDRLIEDLLQFARAGAAPEPGARAALQDVVRDVLADAAPQLEHAEAELVVETIPPVVVACARGTLASMLGNLVNNAAKYVTAGTPPHRVCVRACVKGTRARVEVSDNGPGIPPGSEQVVFEPFRRLGNSTEPGLGIGLATVKRIAEAYDGRVGVTTTHGRGTTFWFEVPIAA
jgi:signal transduction histidine kinase